RPKQPGRCRITALRHEDARPASEATIHFGHAGRGLLVARQDDFDFVLLIIESLVDASSVPTGNPKDMVDTRFLEHFHDSVDGLHTVFSLGLLPPVTLTLRKHSATLTRPHMRSYHDWIGLWISFCRSQRPWLSACSRSCCATPAAAPQWAVNSRT